ncbi:MAG: MotA/TolQ/ExbB proton channel family protein [Bacteroidota bacterium]|nr:MotA/TolQ/ExbB proton channel family protein [Bacteroidota bacterium]MXW15265.1 hypothetical protein [Rhodothermaceae bacterium]MDE2646159.1 MotA/TolQ/ExbB proton channel family protein [Bacteroidota bacterium]MXW31705.1 hypothetical protein [Rhodothermaceae bacterium]MXX96566.1 hypothetical protein [Rhodothermaceae bacterium]
MLFLLTKAQDASSFVSGQAVDEPLLPTSLWDIVEYAQGFEWPLGVLFVIGLFLLTSAYVRQFLQWRGSKAMLKIETENISAEAFSEAIGQSKARNPFVMTGNLILEEFRRGGSAPAMIDYAFRFIELDHEKYKETERYITAAVYIALSLGLLGTLLGIFVLFMSGSRHGASDLVGLGIAVVSTMLALVVRLILWPLNVYLQASLRKRYNTLRKWTIAFAYAISTNSSESVHRN